MLKIYNTLSKGKEEFVPIKDKTVSMYVCGITPYDEVHLGHARCYVVFDVIRRYLKYKGYTIKYIQNFTDIDDKIINKSIESKIPLSELAQKYIDDYFIQMRRLNILDADVYPRVTQKIPEIVKFIEKIVENGYAYVAGGDVYFSVKKFSGYGKLSKRNVDDLKIGARVLPGENKNDPLDFALWKKAKEGEPSWDSPWGKGRPGWHIECSAMSLGEFGGTFDIHGGGQDLIFPHHENEIAQSEAALGKKFANYWIHNGFVTINKEKMSKSLGNFFTLREIFEKYDPMVVRYMLLSQHYRQPLDFSEDKLEQAKSAFSGLENTIQMAKHLIVNDFSENSKQFSDYIYPKKIDFNKVMDDDFNTPEALAYIHERINSLNIFLLTGSGTNETQKLLKETLTACDVLGLLVEKETKIPDSILQLSKEREQARKNKDWKLSDELREKIKKAGFEVEDTKLGPKLKKI